MQTAALLRPPVADETAWDAHRPPPGCYLHDAHGLHGMGHAARVLVWAELIARSMRDEGIDVDIAAVRWAAALHDVRRLHDGRDALHGARCGVWIGEHGCKALAGLSESRRARIAYCCTWHVPPDRQAPAMTPELMCLKDADALDRVRLGGPDVRMLRTPLARSLVGQARFLFTLSMVRGGDPWRAVRDVARHMGLWAPMADTEANAQRCRLRHFRC